MHSDYGTTEWGDMQCMIGGFAAVLRRSCATSARTCGSRVTVVTISEFGRRVKENGNRGLDHGWGNMMLVAGRRREGRPVLRQLARPRRRAAWSTATCRSPPTTATCSARSSPAASPTARCQRVPRAVLQPARPDARLSHRSCQSRVGAHDRRKLDHPDQVSFSRISSRTRPASAWPRISFITAPISAPAAATLPSRILSATSGLAAIARSTAAAEGAVVGDDRQPAGRDDLVGRALAGEHAVEDLAGQLVVDRALVDQRLDRGPRRPG